MLYVCFLWVLKHGWILVIPTVGSVQNSSRPQRIPSYWLFPTVSALLSLQPLICLCFCLFQTGMNGIIQFVSSDTNFSHSAQCLWDVAQSLCVVMVYSFLSPAGIPDIVHSLSLILEECCFILLFLVSSLSRSLN